MLGTIEEGESQCKGTATSCSSPVLPDCKVLGIWISVVVFLM